MKIDVTQKKRNLFTISDHNGACSPASPSQTPSPKKLERLPHVFAKVLELPFGLDTDVLVQETPDSFLFIADSSCGDHVDMLPLGFRARVIKILPGVTKIAVLRVAGAGGTDDSSFEEELSIDTWQFRLPSDTCPEMVSALCVGRQLVVRVPKAVNDKNEDDDYESCDVDINVGESCLFVAE